MSAVDFLFTPGMQRVLSAVYADTGRSFTLNELLAKAGNGKGSTQRQIDRLVDVGVLLEEPRRGRQRSLRANLQYFLFAELHSIAQKSFGLAEPLLDALMPFSGHITEAFVFGSVANTTDSHTSDIDLIVVGHVELLALTEKLLLTEQNLGRSVHLNLYAPDEWSELSESDPVLSQLATRPKLQLIPHDPPPGIRQPHQNARA
ncbi:MAG: hypothetical protein RLZZ618_941 [Pseudomonadota bacterium]|jgi:predicted nucleotidyltransferase